VHPASSNASTLDGRTPAGWRGARAGSLGCKTGCEAYAMPSPPSFRTKPGLLPSFVLFLPPYLSTVLSMLCQSSRSTPSLLLAHHRSTILGRTLFESLFLLRSRAHAFPLGRDCSICCRRCRRRSPRRISSSELARTVLTSTERLSMALQSRNTSNPRPRKTMREHWGYGTGRSITLGPVAF